MAASHTVIGAGPAGLVAAASLAREERRVRVYEQSEVVGHRFVGDFQGLESWSSTSTVLERLAELGVAATFDHRPFYEVTFYGRDLRPTVAHTQEPLFHLVRRGPAPGSLDRALLEQARDAGAQVVLGTRSDRAGPGDIIATGPRHGDGIAAGYVFSTRLKDQAHCIVSDDLAPGGYAYLLIWDGRATLATCLFSHRQEWKQARQMTVDSFRELLPGLDLNDARPFSGFGSVFGAARFVDEAGHLFVGEAAGLQDPEWGFGMWYAMESGALAARSLTDGFDYQTAARSLFERQLEAAFFNRVLYERLPAWIVPRLLRRAALSTDLLGLVRRHRRPKVAKSLMVRTVLGRFSRKRLRHRDRACHRPTCRCVWCAHGDPDRGQPSRACETMQSSVLPLDSIGGLVEAAMETIEAATDLRRVGPAPREKVDGIGPDGNSSGVAPASESKTFMEDSK